MLKHMPSDLARPSTLSFVQRRDLALGDLIPQSLSFPSVDPSTGYPPVITNTFSRLTGLLYCHHHVTSHDDLMTQISRLDVALRRIEIPVMQGNIILPPWMLRHAQTSLESVQRHMDDRLFQILSRAESLPAARAIIISAENFHLPRLIELMGDEAPDRNLVRQWLAPQPPMLG